MKKVHPNRDRGGRGMVRRNGGSDDDDEDIDICDIAPVPSHEETPASARKEDYSARITANDLFFAGGPVAA